MKIDLEKFSLAACKEAQRLQIRWLFEFDGSWHGSLCCDAAAMIVPERCASESCGTVWTAVVSAATACHVCRLYAAPGLQQCFSKAAMGVLEQGWMSPLGRAGSLSAAVAAMTPHRDREWRGNYPRSSALLPACKLCQSSKLQNSDRLCCSISPVSTMYQQHAAIPIAVFYII